MLFHDIYILRNFFFFFLRKNLSTFINVNELHPNVKTKQYEKVHLPSILVNLVCLKYVSPDNEPHYCRFSLHENTTLFENDSSKLSHPPPVDPMGIGSALMTSKLESNQGYHLLV